MSNAPDKIYLWHDECDDTEFISAWFEQSFDDNDVAYIRKDALLEWAERKKNDVKKFGQRYNEANYYNSGCHDTIQELIDKINSL